MKHEELVRLNKFISHNSRFSRREADKLIEEGKVEIGNKVITDLSTKVAEDAIVIDTTYLTIGQVKGKVKDIIFDKRIKPIG